MKTCVLDIETIPCPDAVAQADVDPDAGFPAWPLHQLVCVSILTVDQSAINRPTFSIVTYSRETLAERGIVASVELAIADAREIVTFNGYGFDAPVLLARAAVVGEAVPSIARLAASPTFLNGRHVDLLKEVTRGGAPRIRLLDLCSAFRIPVKQDCGGSDVAAMVRAGEWRRISAYCESDVTATWLALQCWRSAEQSYPDLRVASWSSLAEWIRSGGEALAHLCAFSVPPVLPGGGAALGSVSSLGYAL